MDTLHSARANARRVVLVIALALVGAAGVQAQTVRVLGDLSTTNNLAPFNLSQNSVRYQVAYSAQELNVPGGGLITQVRIHGAVSASQPSYGNLRLRMAHSTLTPQTITSTFLNNYYGSLDEVLGPTVYAPAQNPGQNSLSWYTFVLTTPYMYNGTDTLLLDWSYDSRTGGFNVSSAAGRMRHYIRPANYQTPMGDVGGDSGNHGIEFTILEGPTLAVAPGAGPAQQVFANEQGPGSIGIEAADFTITSNGIAGVSLTSVEIEASGSGDDSTAFIDVALYRDDNASGTFDVADVLIGTPATFAADDGTIVYTVQPGEQDFGTNITRTYFVVVRLAGNAMAGQTFDFAVKDIGVSGTNANKSGVPSVPIPGLIIDTPLFVVTDASPLAAAMAFPGGTAVCQAFTVAYPGGPDDKPAELTINTLGTADESTDLVNAQLWWDFDDDASFVAGNDTLIDTQTFAQDNGSATFSLASLPDFQAGDSRRFFVVYNLGASAAHQTTFQCYVASLGAATLGGVGSGLPAPSNLGAPGLEVLGTVLIATLNGPLAASSVHSVTTGDGNVLCDVTIAAAPGASWTISTLTFEASGTGNHDGAFAELALHEDGGNGTWDGAATDALAAPAAVSFSSNAVSFTLDVPAFGAGIMRRFFLVGKFNGTPVTGETFNARLESATAVNPPQGGSMLGMPTAFTTALVIDSPTLTVANSTSQPATTTHRAGAAGSYTIALFTLTAMNNNATVNGLTLTTGGSGNWTTDVDSLTGVSVYHDDGDGLFNAADTLLFEGGGGAIVPAGFLIPLVMPANSTADLWVRIGFTATAGQGAIAARDTFMLEVASDTDVSATVPVLLGTPLPQGIIVGAIEFSVSSFTPASDLTSGGKPITINGTGFVSPLTVTIGGTLCPGTAVIAGGTTVTGLLVPAGTGSGLPIVITSASLPPQTIGQTFTYSKVGSVGGGSGGGGGGCVGGASGMWLWALALVPVLGFLKRRRAHGRVSRR